jgi:C1A family cysteine protease
MDSVTFQKWRGSHSKVYQSPAEMKFRFKVFLKNLQEIRAHNTKPKTSFKLALNKFSDMTEEEFTVKYTGFKRSKRTRPQIEAPKKVGKNPTSIDWRDQGLVTPVKNQLNCGSCYAFATTGLLEASWKVKTGNLISFSEQQLNDCSQSYGNIGCQGGNQY